MRLSRHHSYANDAVAPNIRPAQHSIRHWSTIKLRRAALFYILKRLVYNIFH